MNTGNITTQRQSGVAIITALLIVALATTISATIATNLQLEVRRTGNLLSSNQALMFVLPAEQLAINILRDDREKNAIDHLGEGWATPDGLSTEEDGVLITGRITDLQACFNINSLQSPGSQDQGGTPASSSNTSIRRFERLLALPDINITPSASSAVVDWIDSDVTTNPNNGAEDLYYMNLEQPYRAANQTFKSVSSLRLVKGFEDNDKFNALLPFICAFDTGISTSDPGAQNPTVPVTVDINVNTAPKEVLLSLADDITESDVSAIEAARELNGFGSLDDLLKINDLNKKITDQSGLSVDSFYFLLTTNLTAGSITKRVYSIINRDAGGNSRVIYRSEGVL